MGYKFNPFTGNLDKTGSGLSTAQITQIALDAIKSIKTTRVGALGNKLYAYDPIEDKWVDLGQRLVFDDNGEIVTGEDE